MHLIFFCAKYAIFIIGNWCMLFVGSFHIIAQSWTHFQPFFTALHKSRSHHTFIKPCRSHFCCATIKLAPDFLLLFFLFLAFIMWRLLPQLQIWEQIIQQIFLPGRYLSLILDYFSKKLKLCKNFTRVNFYSNVTFYKIWQFNTKVIKKQKYISAL